jgi:hypothetical protein
MYQTRLHMIGELIPRLIRAPNTRLAVAHVRTLLGHLKRARNTTGALESFRSGTDGIDQSDEDSVRRTMLVAPATYAAS